MHGKSFTLFNGHTFPALGLGTWQAAEGEVYQAIRQAIKIGYRHIDCAFIYMNEDEIGNALRDAIADGDVTREDLFITTKLWNDCHEPHEVEPAIKASLERLKLDYLDLYLIHWPVAFKKGIHFPETENDIFTLEEMPLNNTWKAMESLVDKGLTNSIGVSNFSIKKLSALLADARIQPAVQQIEAHPYFQRPDLLAYCQEHNIVVTAYSPLGSPGPRPEAVIPKNQPEARLLDNDIIREIAEKHHAKSGQILLAWGLERQTAVIPKSTNPKRLESNFNAQNIALDQEDMEKLTNLDLDYSYCDGDFFKVGDNSYYSATTIWDK